MGYEILLKEIGTRIRSKRKQLRLTQEELAERMDVSVQMISNLELGKKAIRPENIVKISKILSVSTDYILIGTSTDAEFDGLSRKLSLLPEEVCNALETIVDELISQ